MNPVLGAVCPPCAILARPVCEPQPGEHSGQRCQELLERVQGAYIKGSISTALLVCCSQNTAPQLRGCSVRADHSEPMHGCCISLTAAPNARLLPWVLHLPGPAAARSSPCCESWLPGAPQLPTPALPGSPPAGERLCGARSRSRPGSSQLSLPQAPGAAGPCQGSLPAQ